MAAQSVSKNMTWTSVKIVGISGVGIGSIEQLLRTNSPPRATKELFL
ncbi:MAG: hypothetical protein JWL59_4181 [Chthoniobacteraceae bacterium]|nr:hypothetical protein [Chthoniobacteraceae bacterium]